MKRSVLSTRALQDLTDIGRYIAAQNRERAVSFVQALRDRALAAAREPEHHAVREWIGPDIRAVGHGNYMIYMREERERVVILRILHAARDAGPLIG